MKNLFAKLGITNKAEFAAFVIQFIKFGIVGVSNTAVFLGIYYTLLLLGIHYLLANVAAFIISVLNAFFWSRKFVFKKSQKSPMSKQLAKVYATYGFTFALSTTTLFIMVEILNLSAFIAPLINLFITVPINFLVNKFWAFR
ncbi:MAG: GtrA family protein [Defluviitaleaceae bacterium]|nr:GtrA family protein [Defluviitaleaceae bacterium]